jgi:hypothetical protein
MTERPILAAQPTLIVCEVPFTPKAIDRQIWPQPSTIRGDYADRQDREYQIVGDRKLA